MDQPRITALFRPGAKGEPMVALQTATLLPDFGVEGDRHAKHGSSRQVLVVDQDTLARFDLEPGQLDENILTTGLAINDLPQGQQLQIGDVVLEITIPCTVCHKLDELRPGLLEAMRGQRGKFTRVISGGEIKVGDRVTLVPHSIEVG